MGTRSSVAIAGLVALLGCQGEVTAPAAVPTFLSRDSAMVTAVADSVLLVVAGDMHANCQNRADSTAAIVARFPQALVIPLGDNAGQHGSSAEYNCYDQTWGAFKSRTYGVIGNHELNRDTAGTAYYDYFNGAGVDSGRAGHRGRGYYTLQHGGWRIFVANPFRNFDDQTAWMARELATRPTRCTMAIWHRPLFTSSAEPNNVQRSSWLRPWWRVLYNSGADLILAGHVHSYERFAELRPDGVVDGVRGIREFVVGTGGSGPLFPFQEVPRVGSQKRLRAWGVLRLTLWPTRYRWEFIDVKGAVLDRGGDTCH